LNLAKRPNNPCFRKLHHVCTQVFSMKLVDYIELRYATTIPFFMQVYATTFFIYKDRIFFLPFILYIYIYIIVIKGYILDEGYLCHLIKYVSFFPFIFFSLSLIPNNPLTFYPLSIHFHFFNNLSSYFLSFYFL